MNFPVQGAKSSSVRVDKNQWVNGAPFTVYRINQMIQTDFHCDLTFDLDDGMECRSVGGWMEQQKQPRCRLIRKRFGKYFVSV